MNRIINNMNIEETERMVNELIGIAGNVQKDTLAGLITSDFEKKNYIENAATHAYEYIVIDTELYPVSIISRTVTVPESSDEITEKRSLDSFRRVSDLSKYIIGNVTGWKLFNGVLTYNGLYVSEEVLYHFVTKDGKCVAASREFGTEGIGRRVFGEYKVAVYSAEGLLFVPTDSITINLNKFSKIIDYDASIGIVDNIVSFNLDKIMNLMTPVIDLLEIDEKGIIVTPPSALYAASWSLLHEYTTPELLKNRVVPEADIPERHKTKLSEAFHIPTTFEELLSQCSILALLGREGGMAHTYVVFQSLRKLTVNGEDVYGLAYRTKLMSKDTKFYDFMPLPSINQKKIEEIEDLLGRAMYVIDIIADGARELDKQFSRKYNR